MFGFGTALRDLSVAASRGEFEPAFGREEAVARVIEMQSWIRRKNILVTGRPGCGKTRFLQGVVLSSLQGPHTDSLLQYHFYELQVSTLRTATVRIHDAVQMLIHAFREDEHQILIIPQILPLLEAEEDRRKPMGILGPAIRRGEVRCIGTMTQEDYRHFAHREPGLANAFAQIELGSLSREMTLLELERLGARLAREHRVQIPERMLRKAVDLSEEYLPDQDLPGKAVNLLTQACALCAQRVQAQKSGKTDPMDSSLKPLGSAVASYDLKCALRECGKVDVFAAEAHKWKTKLARRMENHVFGQSAAVEQLVSTMSDIRMRFGAPGCPAGVLLFGGPRGVGKAYTAKVLAHELMQTGQNAAVVDLAQAGAGSAEDLLGGIWANATEGGPLKVVVMRSMEAAHPALLGPLLRLIASGCARNLPCRLVPQRKCLFVLTLNTESSPKNPAWLKDLVAAHVRREIVQRFDAIVPFGIPSFAAQCQIMRQALGPLYQDAASRQIRIGMGEEAFRAVTSSVSGEDAFVPGLLAALKKIVVLPVYDLVNSAAMDNGGVVDILVREGRVFIQHKALRERVV